MHGVAGFGDIGSDSGIGGDSGGDSEGGAESIDVGESKSNGEAAKRAATLSFVVIPQTAAQAGLQVSPSSLPRAF